MMILPIPTEDLRKYIQDQLLPRVKKQIVQDLVLNVRKHYPEEIDLGRYCPDTTNFREIYQAAATEFAGREFRKLVDNNNTTCIEQHSTHVTGLAESAELIAKCIATIDEVSERIAKSLSNNLTDKITSESRPALTPMREFL